MIMRAITALFLISLFALQVKAQNCEALQVNVTGSLSSRAHLIYETLPSELTPDDQPHLDVSLADFNASNSRISIRLSRTNDDMWRVDYINTLSEAEKPDASDYTGPISNVMFGADGKQAGEISLSFEPIINDPNVRLSVVRLTVAGLQMNDTHSRLEIKSSVRTAIECPVSPRVLSVKTIANEERDELNPIIGQDALNAYK